MVMTTAAAPTGTTLNPTALTTGATSLTITGGNWDGWYLLGGGYSATAAVDGYSLTLDGVASSGSHITSIVGGWANTTASNNTLTLKNNTSVTATEGIIGGMGTNTDKNTVNITDSTINVSRYTSTLSGLVGGLSYSGDATNNNVNISGGTVESNAIAGGYATEGTGKTVSGNTAHISGGTTGAASPTALVGGFANGTSMTVKENTAVLSGGTITGGIVGGAAMGSGATVTNNTAIVTGGNFTGGSNSYTGTFIPGAVVGGAAYNGASARGNTVKITGGNVSGYIMGGVGNAASGSVTAATVAGNTVALSGTSSSLNLAQARIYGSALYAAGNISTTGAGGDNTLRLATQGVSAYNIHNFQNIIVDFAQLSTAPMLTLTMGETLLGGATFTKTGELAATAIGATGLLYPVLKNNNGISGMSAESEKWVAAGNYNYRFTSTNDTINAEIYKQGSNSSTVDTEVTGDVYGGRAMVDDNSSDTNTLTITAKVNGNAYGGYSQGGAATGNQVSITGAAVTGNVYGGYSGKESATTNNTVTLKNATAGGNIYGGSNSITTGNQLNLSGVNTVSGTVRNFETIALAADTAWSPGSTVLSANRFINIGALDISQAANLQAAGTSGTMTLLASGTENDLSALTLKYYGGQTANLTTDHSSQIVKTVDGGENKLANGVTYTSGATNHTVSLDSTNNYKNVLYTVTTGGGVSKIDLANWDGNTSASMNVNPATGATIETDGMLNLPTATGETTILTSNAANYFTGYTINGANKYHGTAYSNNATGIGLTGTQGQGVTVSDNNQNLVYKNGTFINTITLDTVTWAKGTTLLTDTTPDYTHAAIAGNFAMNFTNPTEVTAGDTMTLLAANDTLTEMSAKTHELAYTDDSTVPGLNMAALLSTTAQLDNHNIVAKVTANKASSLTFGEMNWNNGAAFMDHSTTLANVSFDGAAVDTSKITFTDLTQLTDGDKTLVANFNGKPGTITGNAYTIGSGLQGKGAASFDESANALVFKATSNILTPTETAHNVLMGTSANVTALVAANANVSAAIAGLATPENTGSDGVAVYAHMGGSKTRQETGSHVDSRLWNAIVAIGTKKTLGNDTLEWGGFFEYGKGNYTAINGDSRGDGTVHYAGGGILAKWTTPQDIYYEGSIRTGHVKDDANGTYGYNTDTEYFGAHLGIGKIYRYDGHRQLDVYGKFFYAKKNDTSFNAGGNHYDIDAAGSKLFRIGARYTASNNSQWKCYAGLAYEHEFDGKTTGKVDGIAIRPSSTKGGSVLAELGIKMEATDTNPWKMNIGIHGSAGKNRGIGGSIGVAYMF